MLLFGFLDRNTLLLLGCSFLLFKLTLTFLDLSLLFLLSALNLGSLLLFTQFLLLFGGTAPRQRAQIDHGGVDYLLTGRARFLRFFPVHTGQDHDQDQNYMHQYGENHRGEIIF